MRRFKTGWLLLLLASMVICSCKNNGHPKVVEKAYYYWKSTPYSLSKAEVQQVNDLKVKKLYVKFFEVQPDAVYGNMPVAKTNLSLRSAYTSSPELDFALSRLEIIPVIFIQNKVLEKITPADIDSLASNIVFLADKYFKMKISSEKEYTEMQIDCDWTKTTRDHYFQLLRSIKKQSGKIVSCTLRLYPYKYRESMGIPPVDKATLMCYNLISPLNAKQNSILDTKELESYLLLEKKYPVHLDVALPVFAWMQVYQNTLFTSLVNETHEDLKNILKPVKPMWYEVMKDTLIDDMYLRAGDLLKSEEVTPDAIDQAVDLLKKHVFFQDTIRVSLFHLDDKTVKMYSNETLDSFYTGFVK